LRWRFDGWSFGVFVVAALLALPVVVVGAYVFLGSGEVWSHLAATVLPEYISNSLWLALGVATGTLVIGTGTAWLTVMCEFPGRRYFSWLLLIPLAMPAYIIAYTYTGLLDFAGPVQTALRAWFGWGYGDYWFPEIRSLPGAVVMLTLVLYPYVYLLARAAFLEQSICVLDVGRSLGISPLGVFTRVALPLARPAIVTGLSLVLMETLADYGTVKYFGVSTFTTGIFRTWFGMGEPAAAAQLAAMLLGFVLLLIVLERWSRRQRQYHHTSRKYQPIPSFRLSAPLQAIAVLACVLPILLGFILPSAQLFFWSMESVASQVATSYPRLVLNSLLLATLTAILSAVLAAFLAYGRRVRQSGLVRGAVRMAGMAYAIPGTVIAVGVIIPFAWFDNTLDNWMRQNLGVSTGLLLSGSLVALVFAYLVRFLAVSLQTVEAALTKISTHFDDTARSLGCRRMDVLRRIHLPLMQGSLLTAGLLVFVDVMKELPATLILRPFNFNTLAVRAFELAEDEQLAAAAPSALTIALVGLVPVILLSRAIARSRPGQRLTDA
jgi:iron(III) transport system permease protein